MLNIVLKSGQLVAVQRILILSTFDHMYPLLQAIKLLRIPFSVFLMPIFWFALSFQCDPGIGTALGVFCILHLLAYPASNGYNSWFDRDEGSIGGLKEPPPVNDWLFRLVILFDLLAIGFGFWMNAWFGEMITVYLLVSKAYSWDKIRLKKYPILSTIVVTFFQGAFTYWMVMTGLGLHPFEILDSYHWVFALGSTLMLNGSYPLTQIYQHADDRKRGDRTLSILLGVKGTFVYSILFFLLGFGLIGLGFGLIHSIGSFLILILFSQPVLIYFMIWWRLVLKDPLKADFERVMFMNKLSSISLSLAFIAIWFFQCRLG